MTDVSDVLNAAIIRVMFTLTPETSVNVYQTTQPNIKEDSHI
jgi:hypothetical protein